MCLVRGGEWYLTIALLMRMVRCGWLVTSDVSRLWAMLFVVACVTGSYLVVLLCVESGMPLIHRMRDNRI